MYTYLRYICTYKCIYIPTYMYKNIYVLLSVKPECPKVLITINLQSIVQTQNKST